MRDSVCAVVLNYRQANLTVRCVSALCEQVKCVLVVDNSGDESESLKLNKYLAKLRNECHRGDVRVLDSGVNLGFARGVQMGIDWASKNLVCEAFLVMNNDALASEDMVQEILSVFGVTGGLALVGPRVIDRSSSSLLWYHRLFGLVLRRAVPGAFPYISGACLFVPASLVQPYFFDHEFFMYGEDVELSWRMAKMQVPLMVVDAAKYEHEGSASSRIGSLFYEYHVARGHILLARKLATNRLDWLLLLLGRAVSLPLRACVRCVRYRSLIPCIALVRAWLRKPPASPNI